MSEKIINIHLLSSFTDRSIGVEILKKCEEIGVKVSLSSNGYNQYVQEILNPGSALYQNNPQLIIFFIDVRSILGDYFFLPYQLTTEERHKFIDNKLAELLSLVETIKHYSQAKILFHNFEVPIYSTIGILEHKEAFGLKEAIEFLNHKLRSVFKNDPQVFLFDFNEFCSKIGKKHVFDYKMYYLADMKVNMRFVSALCGEYIAFIKAMLFMAKKCIVLDLDNTLWGGIVGEDGVEGIKLGPTTEGRSFWEFQKYLLALFHRGVILAVNSKNNPEDVAHVFAEHPYMILKEEHFAAMRVNWEDKVSNMRSLAEEINITLDSLVFFDDDKMNREFVRSALPEVTVVDLPPDSSLYVSTLMELDLFFTLQLTEEDRERGKMYAVDRQRKIFYEATTDLSHYLRGLEMIMTIEYAHSLTLPRIAQLTQKTNQFNMTTRRYTEEEVGRLVQDNCFLIISIRVEDKFGDNGTVGVVIVEKGDTSWRIDTFLLSCRVIGRRIEEALLAYLIDEATKNGVGKIIAEFIPTKKNTPAKEFYKKNGFILKEFVDGNEIWEYNFTTSFPYPDFIKVIVQ